MKLIARRVLTRLLQPGSREAAFSCMEKSLACVPNLRRHPVDPDILVTTRARSTFRRARVIPPRPPFLDHSSSSIERPLHGNALEVLKDSHPSLVGLLENCPIRTPFTIWGRPWIVKQSSLGVHAGLGLFALMDIIVPDGCPPDGRPALFPFYGPKYGDSHWQILSRQCPTFGRYGLRITGDRRYSFVDGYPPRTSNPAGYINSCRGHVWQGVLPNAEWHEYYRSCHQFISPRCTHYVLTHALTTIRQGDEILVDYEWRRP